MTDSPNQLYFGDNLDILRQHIADESVDLTCFYSPLNPAAARKAGGALLTSEQVNTQLTRIMNHNNHTVHHI